MTNPSRLARRHPLNAMRYVTPQGDDGWDGLTWETAKRTITGAYDALPSTGGDIHFRSERDFGSPVDISPDPQNVGLWITDARDPQYNSLPAGWRPAKRFSLVGHGGNVSGSLSPGTNAARINGGHPTDSTKPAFWFPYVSGGVVFRRVYTTCAQPMKIAIDRNLARDTGSSSGLGFYESSFIGQSSATRDTVPLIDVGYTFWDYWEHCVFGNVNISRTVTSVTLVSGTTYRYTVSTTHGLSVGDRVYLTGFTPSGYNSGTAANASYLTWPVVAVNAGAKTFDVDIGTNPAAVSVYGTMGAIWSKQTAFINFESAGATYGRIGYITVKDCLAYGGHFRSTGDLLASEFNGVTVESSAGWPTAPAVYIKDATRDLDGLKVENVFYADIGAGGAPPALVVEEREPLGHAPLYGSTKVSSPSGAPQGLALPGATPGLNQIGFWRNKVVGQHDTARRMAAPSVTRFTNLVGSWDFSTWTQAGTVTTGIADPLGGTTAVRVAGASGSVSKGLGSLSLAVGDYIIVGMWIRSATAGTALLSVAGHIATTGAATLRFGTPATGVNYIDYAPLMNPNEMDGAQNDWKWEVFYSKVVQTGGGAYTTTLSYLADATHSLDLCAPTAIYVPASGSYTDAEVQEIARHLAPIHPSTVVGDASVITPLSLKGTRVLTGTGTPESSVTAPVGSLYLRTNGGAGTSLYVKETGSGNTGWAAK